MQSPASANRPHVEGALTPASLSAATAPISASEKADMSARPIQSKPRRSVARMSGSRATASTAAKPMTPHGAPDFFGSTGW